MNKQKNKIPEGWEEIDLANNEFFEILPSGIEKFEGEKDYISTESIQGTKIKKIESRITYKNRPSRANMQPTQNSVWFAKMKNTNKVYSFTEENFKEINKYILSTGFCGIKCEDKVYPKFLKQIFLSYLFNKQKNVLATGSTQEDIKQEFIKKIKIIIPTSLSEQKAIALILSKVDEAIENSDKILKKIERVKRGVMRRVFEKIKNHLKRPLGELLILCQYGLSNKMGDEGKYPIFKMDDISKGKISLDKVKMINLDKKTFESFKLMKGDILFNRTNSFEHVGRTGIFDLDIDAVFASYLIRLRVDDKIIDPNYLTYYLIFKRDEIRTKYASRAVQQSNINATNLQKYPIKFPKILKEQQRIAKILLTIDERLELERKRKEKLERLKKGLMNELLTGNKRVNVKKILEVGK